jgi:hypothetical protein
MVSTEAARIGRRLIELTRWLQEANASSTSTVKVVFEIPPCANCAANGTKQVPCGKRLRCAGCKYVHYCGRDCAREDWSNHKVLCKRTQTEPRIGVILNKIYVESGLYTNGVGMWASPVKAGPELQEIGMQLERFREIVELLPDEGAAMATTVIEGVIGMLKNYEVDVINPKLMVHDDRPMVVSLHGHCMNFHEQCYGFAFPADYARIGDALKQRGISRVIDPLAGSRIAADLFEIFAGIPVIASDIKPKNECVAKADALDRYTYTKHNPRMTAILLGWADYGGKGDLGARIIKIVHSIGFETMVVMREDHRGASGIQYEAAFSPVSTNTLNLFYKRIEPMIAGFGILRVKNPEGMAAFERMVNESKEKVEPMMAAISRPLFEKMLKDGTGQSIALYQIVEDATEAEPISGEMDANAAMSLHGAMLDTLSDVVGGLQE